MWCGAGTGQGMGRAAGDCDAMAYGQEAEALGPSAVEGRCRQQQMQPHARSRGGRA